MSRDFCQINNKRQKYVPAALNVRGLFVRRARGCFFLLDFECRCFRKAFKAIQDPLERDCIRRSMRAATRADSRGRWRRGGGDGSPTAWSGVVAIATC